MFVKSQRDFLLRELKSYARDAGRFNLAKYLGTSHTLFNVGVPQLRRIAVHWAKEHKAPTQLIELIDLLYNGVSREEKVLASMILGRFPKRLAEVDETYLDRWLGKLEGWEEVDSMCDEIDVWFRSDTKKRYHVLKHWNNDMQIEKRRASLVVLCSSVRLDDSKEFARFAFLLIDALKAEKHVMITKAISWLLRSLIKYHLSDVRTYLQKNTSTLPNIAVRETITKLETGKK